MRQVKLNANSEHPRDRDAACAFLGGLNIGDATLMMTVWSKCVAAPRQDRRRAGVESSVAASPSRVSASSSPSCDGCKAYACPDTPETLCCICGGICGCIQTRIVFVCSIFHGGMLSRPTPVCMAARECLVPRGTTRTASYLPDIGETVARVMTTCVPIRGAEVHYPHQYLKCTLTPIKEKYKA